MAKHVHILGICGRAAAGVAALLQDQGWRVTGSDQGAYPPITEYLTKHDIPYFDRYSAEHITPDIDLIIVAGNTLHVDPQNPEYVKAQKLGIQIKSYPEILSEYVIKPQSIVVTGTYGKTTITALLVKIFTEAGLNPSYMIGDLSLDFEENIKVTNSSWSIVEGDEHPTLGYNDKPKFAFYQSKYVILTSAMWDHYNVYKTEEEYVQVYKNLLSKLPKNGLVLASASGKNVDEILESATCPVYRYSRNTINHVPTKVEKKFWSTDVKKVNDLTLFTFHEPDNSFPIETRLFGEHNIENITAAVALARLQGIKVEIIQHAIKNFHGLKRRLELVGDFNNVKIYHDQGQLPVKAKAALDALRQQHPEAHLMVVYDPNASVLHEVEVLQQFKYTFRQANEVIVSKMQIRKLQNNQAKQSRVTGKKLIKAISQHQPNITYIPLDEVVLSELKNMVHAHKRTVILFLTTGGIRGLIEKTVDQFSH